MNDDKPWAFTCKTCASHNLNVFRFWRILAGPDSESWQEWGPLSADHRWHFEFKKKLAKESDFNPKGIWPEPRYLEAWQQRGWLKTEDSRL